MGGDGGALAHALVAAELSCPFGRARCAARRCRIARDRSGGRQGAAGGAEGPAPASRGGFADPGSGAPRDTAHPLADEAGAGLWRRPRSRPRPLRYTQVQTTAYYAHLAAEPVRMAADAVASSLRDALQSEWIDLSGVPDTVLACDTALCTTFAAPAEPHDGRQ